VKTLEYLKKSCKNRIEAGMLDYGIRIAKEKLASK